MRHPDRIFERDQLLDWVWGRSTYIEIRTIDVSICDYAALNPFGLNGTIQTLNGVPLIHANLLDHSPTVSPDIASRETHFENRPPVKFFLMFWQHASY